MDFDVLTGKGLIRRNCLDKVFCLQKVRDPYGKGSCSGKKGWYKKQK